MAKKYASAVIKIAKEENGYLEKKSNKDLDSKTKNVGSNNWTKYGKWYGLNPDYWCAMFVSWCFNKAYGDCDLMYGKSASCEVTRKRFEDKWRFFKSNPKVGDLIFFSGSRHSGANHIGIVTSVSNTTVYTMEGNTSSDTGVVDNGGSVNNKAYNLKDNHIIGYGRPLYDESLINNVVTKVVTKKGYTGTYPFLGNKGYLKIGDNGVSVKYLQKYLNWYGGYGLKVDGVFGNKTVEAVRKFQKSQNIVVDGKFGAKSLNKAKSVKK